MNELSLSEEQELLLRLREGDRDAFELIYKAHYYRLTGLLIRLLKSTDLAQEVVQDTFVSLWDNRANVQKDRSIMPYLYRIASNKSFNIFKKATHDQKYRAYLYPILEEGYEQIETRLFQKEQREILQQIIDRMPERQRQIFIRCKLDGKTYDEVATELQVSVHTVHTQIKRANQLIRETLIQYPDFLAGVLLTAALGVSAL
ncbi:RNA polymerase sigma factor [Sphingobacterium faecale]|uniref:RNA polymerase sigma-70 factor n=1 Tax=Sphingobacterium faecale TaxID=2803775 RepID=A0ABS1R9Z9_9SPHI|nr:RNA polymerase sigma-70 factor [Sphingobacterium faecale]MBL1411538.1 RNA polymerase sigma-70 factor [Sphingobacterium faecale]